MSHSEISTPLPGVEARTGSGHYGVFDHGAHVFAWQPDGQQPVIWMSSQAEFATDKAIRGGVPICFPWFGPSRTKDKKPAHGFARTTNWTRTGVTDGADGSLVVEYALDRARSGQQPEFPYSYAAYYRVTFAADHLELRMTVVNADDQPFTYELALHTYLAVGDVRQISVAGLEGADYMDKVAGSDAFDSVQDGLVTLSGETDRVYAHHDAVVLDDPAWGRKLRVSKVGSTQLVLWNPWAEKAAAMADVGDDDWTGMVCIEALNGFDDSVTLQPGDSAVLTQRITLI
jgi:glucose-6-phosphate 1-epimerase